MNLCKQSLKIFILLFFLTACDPALSYNISTSPAYYHAMQTQPAKANQLSTQAANADQTLLAAGQTAEAYHAVQTATMEAGRIQSTQEAAQLTRQAAASATKQAWTILGWTATAGSANATGTAVVRKTEQAAAATATAQEVEFNAEMQRLSMDATAQSIKDAQKRSNLDIQQRELMNSVWAVSKWAIPVALLVVAAVFLLIFAFSSRAKWSAIYPAPNGDKPVLSIGGKLVDMDRSAAAVLDPKNPTIVPPEIQAVLVAGDQRVDAVLALQGVNLNAPALPAATPGKIGFQLIGEGDAPPAHLLPDPDVIQILDGDWKDKP